MKMTVKLISNDQQTVVGTAEVESILLVWKDRVFSFQPGYGDTVVYGELVVKHLDKSEVTIFP